MGGASAVGPMNEEKRKAVLRRVYAALQEKGYSPLGQIVGYILTEDPTYITNYDGARQLIAKLDRDELMRDMLADYFSKIPAP